MLKKWFRKWKPKMSRKLEREMAPKNRDPQLHVFPLLGKRSKDTVHHWRLITVEQGLVLLDLLDQTPVFSSCAEARFGIWAFYSHALASGSQLQETSWQLSYYFGVWLSCATSSVRLVLGLCPEAPGVLGGSLAFSVKLAFGIKKYKLCEWNSVEPAIACLRNMLEHVNITADTRLSRLPFWELFSCFWMLSDVVETCQVMPKLCQTVLVMSVTISWVSHWILSEHAGTW